MGARKKAYKKYLEVESKGTDNYVREAYGFLYDLYSPEEQGLEEFTSVKLADDVQIEVPTGWRAIIVTEDGEEVSWRWPGHKVGDKSELGINVIAKGHKLKELFDSNSCWHFYRDDKRRARIDLVEDE